MKTFEHSLRHLSRDTSDQQIAEVIGLEDACRTRQSGQVWSLTYMMGPEVVSL